MLVPIDWRCCLITVSFNGSRFKVQDVYLGTRSHPEWVFFRKSAKQSAPKKHIKICMYK